MSCLKVDEVFMRKLSEETQALLCVNMKVEVVIHSILRVITLSKANPTIVSQSNAMARP